MRKKVVGWMLAFALLATQGGMAALAAESETETGSSPAAKESLEEEQTAGQEAVIRQVTRKTETMSEGRKQVEFLVQGENLKEVGVRIKMGLFAQKLDLFQIVREGEGESQSIKILFPENETGGEEVYEVQFFPTPETKGKIAFETSYEVRIPRKEETGEPELWWVRNAMCFGDLYQAGDEVVVWVKGKHLTKENVTLEFSHPESVMIEKVEHPNDENLTYTLFFQENPEAGRKEHIITAKAGRYEKTMKLTQYGTADTDAPKPDVKPEPTLPPVIQNARLCCEEITAEGGEPTLTLEGENLKTDNWNVTVEAFEKGTDTRVEQMEVTVEKTSATSAVLHIPENKTGKELQYQIWIGVKAKGTEPILKNLYQQKKEAETEPIEEDPQIREGWKEDQTGKWYQYGDGSYPKAEAVEIEGEIYYFNAVGYLECCRWIQTGGHWYYLTYESKAAKGWVGIGGSWYFFDKKTAQMQTGWLKEGDVWYFLDGNGVMKTGWLYTGGSWYYLGETGAMQTGWLHMGGSWYYLDETGAMKTGWLREGDSWYYLEGTGVMKTGWLYTGGSWYYLEGNGAMRTGWFYTGGSWYYLEENGAMKTGWLLEKGNWYYLKGNGVMAAGVALSVSGTSYRFDGNGKWIG